MPQLRQPRRKDAAGLGHLGILPAIFFLERGIELLLHRGQLLVALRDQDLGLATGPLLGGVGRGVDGQPGFGQQLLHDLKLSAALLSRARIQPQGKTSATQPPPGPR